MTASLFRSLSVLRPDDAELSETTRWRIQAYRLLCLLGGILLPLFGILYRLSAPEAIDPMWARLLLMSGFLGLVGVSYVSRWMRHHYVSLVQGWLYVILAWFVIIATLNQMAGAYAVGLLFVFSVLSVCIGIGVDTPRPLTWFLGYGILLVTGGCIAVPSPKTSSSILITCVVASAMVLYVAVRAQLAMQRTLRRMTEEARAANRLKSALLSNMSHEVRTPLTSILGFAELIANADADNPKALASRIRESGERLLDTLNAVLQVSRLESGGVDLEPQRLNATEIVAECVDEFVPVAQEKGVQLRLDVPDAPVPVHLAPEALRRIVDVLVRNAVEFSEEGDRARVAVEQAGEQLVLTVADTGIGMSEAVLDEVFEAFRQESIGQDRTHEGPGLGLTVARRLVDLLDGSIEIDSEKGEGTRVVVQLPRREPVPA